MKKTLARFLTMALALAMIVCCFGGFAVSAAESDEEYTLFIAYGGDKAAENDWGYEYYGTDTEKSAGITATNATAKVGDTVTISLAFETANVNSWFFAPCLVPGADGQEITNIDFDVSLKIDGNDVAIDMAADADGKTWWVEGTGEFSNSIRLAGGYNEWATKYIAEPAGFSTIEYTITLNSIEVGAAASAGGQTESTEEYDLFIAYGGDKAAENDWGYEYYGADTDKSAGITATNAKVKSGDTVTVSLSFAEANVNSWFFAPCLIPAADGQEITGMDISVVCKIDGVEVPVDMAADSEGRTWWVEGTGEYANSIRLAGGYNEWGAKFIAEPAGFSTIEYTITFNAILVGSANASEIDSTAEYDLFIAFGGDKAAENDWGLSYDATADVEGITAVNAKAKAGDTVTISLTFDSPVVNAWWFAPVLAGTGIGTEASTVDFDIVCKIDGVEVPIDFAADADGRTWWAEASGAYTAEDCLRLAGGYNEWGAHFIAEPAGFTTLEYTITLNAIKLAVAQEPEIVEIPIDLNGTYNAYLMLQTPNWTFRDAHDSANGIGSAIWGQHITNNDTGTNYGVVTDAVIAGNGTYTVSITDFGTIFADDFAAASQDYFNIIAVSTDIPKSDKISVTDVQLIVDGQVRHKYDTAYLNADAKETIQIMIQNIWNADVKEIGYYPAPSSSLEIQFTVSGFAYDKEAEEPVVTPTEPEATEPQATTPAATDPAPTTPAPVEPKGGNTGLIVGIIVAVVAAGVVCGVVLKKKKA